MDEDDRSTPTLRILRHPAMLLVLAVLTAFCAIIVTGEIGKVISGTVSGPAGMLAAAVTVAVLFIAVYAAFRYWVEGQPVREFAMPGAASELGAGFLTGLILFSIIVGVIAVFGGYRVIGTHPWSVLVPALAIAILSGVTEEIMFRGWFFRLVERWLGSWAALVLSAVLFGALHLHNPNATLLAGIAIMFEAGIMLAAIYMITRRLWAVIGLHAAWNLAQGGLYGIPVSGENMDGVLRPDIRGSDLLTGGAFGAEASLPAIVVATAFGLVLLYVAWRRGRFMAPLWVRRRQGVVEQA